jgi:lipooligosaccharide transport system ATP-binding protein
VKSYQNAQMSSPPPKTRKPQKDAQPDAHGHYEDHHQHAQHEAPPRQRQRPEHNGHDLSTPRARVPYPRAFAGSSDADKSVGGLSAVLSKVDGVSEQPMIVARGLVKRFGDFTAVDGIDVEVSRGEAFGFLGPNGAGKSSTMRMIGCVSPVTDGTLRVLGHDPAVDGARIRARLGVVPQEDTLDFELSVMENLIVYGRYFGMSHKQATERGRELLEFVQLEERATSQVEPLSGGMKRRLTIARSLINDPDMLLLDEPTTGLDPQARHVVWDRLFRLKQRGVTLVLTTHYMDEAEQLCDRLVVMDRGRIAAEGSPAALIRDWSTREVVELRFAADDTETSGEKIEALVEQPERPLRALVSRVEVLPDRVLLYSDDGDATVGELHGAGVEPQSVLVRRSSLEDVFLRLTGRSLVE